MVSIPIHLKLINLESLGNPIPSPIGVQTRIDLTAPLVAVPGSITAKITQATIAVEAIAADPAVADNQYATDKTLALSLYGINLDDLLSQQIQSYAQAIIGGIGDINVVVPTLTQIETFIGNQVYADLIATPNIGIWTPNVGSNTQVTVNNVTPQVLSDALAICLNSESGANPSALTNFIPAGNEFALAVDGPRVLAIIQQTINEPQSQGGLGGIPTTLNNVDGHTVNINSLTTTLQEGSIHFEGNVTVVNAIAGHIDVSADFHADAGMTWINNSDGSQSIQPVELWQRREPERACLDLEPAARIHQRRTDRRSYCDRGDGSRVEPGQQYRRRCDQGRHYQADNRDRSMAADTGRNRHSPGQLSESNRHPCRLHNFLGLMGRG